MKKQILLLILSFILLSASAQRVTLNFHQDFNLPDIPQITQTGDTLHSSSPTGNQWLKDDIELQGETKQNLFIAGSGTYKVIVTNDSGCSSESNAFSAVTTDIATIQTAEFTCKVYPNPSNGIFTIELESEKSEVFVLELLSSNGNLIMGVDRLLRGF